MSRGVRICGACGAKNHPDWRLCQRCRGDLSAAPADAAAPGAGASRRLPWGLAAGAAAVVVAVIAWPSSGPAPAREVSAGTRTPGATPAESAAPPGTTDRSAEAARAPVTREDFARAGEAAYAQGQLDVALSAFEAAVAAFPGDGEARNNLGQLLVRLDRVPEALEHLEAAVAADGRKWAYRFNLARARGQGGDWAGAAADYRLASDLFPGDHVTLYNLGRALQRTGDEAGAAAALEQAVALAPEESSFLLTLAASYEKLSRLPDAIVVYRQFLEKEPGSSDAAAIRSRIAGLERVGHPDAGTAAEATAAPPPGA
jgi:tetratricopeptide (TPR) repeat protein